MATTEVASYEGRAQVFPITATNQSFVLWTSEYKANDEAAVGEFCNLIYHALLAALATHFAG